MLEGLDREGTLCKIGLKDRGLPMIFKNITVMLNGMTTWKDLIRERSVLSKMFLIIDSEYKRYIKAVCKLESSNKLFKPTILALVTDSEASLSNDDDRIKMLLFLFLLAIDEIGRDLPIFGLGRACGRKTEYTSSR